MPCIELLLQHGADPDSRGTEGTVLFDAAQSPGHGCLSPFAVLSELAALGRTNREIANELFVTVKAVEWHLGNSYRKLDIRGRGALAQALGARD